LKGRSLPPWRYEFITPPGPLQPRSDAKGYFVHTALGPALMTNPKNAARGVIEWLVREKNLSREDAYVLCSLAVDLKISQIVDAPNWGVSAYLALGVFTDVGGGNRSVPPSVAKSGANDSAPFQMRRCPSTMR